MERRSAKNAKIRLKLSVASEIFSKLLCIPLLILILHSGQCINNIQDISSSPSLVYTNISSIINQATSENQHGREKWRHSHRKRLSFEHFKHRTFKFPNTTDTEMHARPRQNINERTRVASANSSEYLDFDRPENYKRSDFAIPQSTLTDGLIGFDESRSGNDFEIETSSLNQEVIMESPSVASGKRRDSAILRDIKYLRRHLNKGTVNFLMTDTLVDGEKENRIHFNGITAKETYVGSNRTGLKLRQLTDGSHLVQVLYTSEGDIYDCEYITQKKSVRNFLKTMRNEFKQALQEENERIFERMEHNPRDVNENYFRHFENVTFRIFKDGEQLSHDFEWLDYDRLRLQCLEKHEEIKYLVERRNSGSKVSKVEAENTLTRKRRSFRENFIIPGTKWCGAGQLASRYSELGLEQKEDKCCRSHDTCPRNILPFHRRFGVFNARLYTVSHCRCDRRKKRELMDSLRIPGTKWCGKGFTATSYQQLGGHSKTDRCCRMHDLRCPFWIGGMEKKYGLFNWRVNTLMHCRCDERFRACLKLADTSVSNMVGKLFFNVVQTKCFVLKPNKVCMQRSWWGKCLKRGYAKQAHLRDNLPY